MSLENVTLDFGHLSFDNNSNSTSNLSTAHYNSVKPSIKITKENIRGNRNRKCVPSDDEDDDEEEEDDDLSSDDEYSGPPRGKSALRTNNVITSTITTPTKPIRKSQPLPSDDEDEDEDEEDEEEDEEDDNKLLGSKVVAPIGRTSPDPNYRSGPIQKQQQQHSPQEDFYQYQGGNTSRDYLNYYSNDDNDALINHNNMRSPSPTPPILTLPEGSHLQQLQQMQQYHQSQMAQFQYHQMQQQQQQPSPSKSSSSHLLRPGTPSNGQRVSMNGMDLLKQLEQEKADAKRLKPKLDTSHVKIEGLLGRLPEPGSHNISFQQLQQQQQQQQHQHHLQQQQQQQLLLQQQQFQQQQFQYQQQFQQQQQQQQQHHTLNTKKSKQRLTAAAPGYLEPYYQQYPPRSPSPNGTRHRQQSSRGSNNLY